MVVLRSRSSVACSPDVHQMFLSGSSLPPVSLPRLFLTPLAPKPSCGSADFSFAARYNLRRRVQSRQLNLSELDVASMYLATATRCPDRMAWRRGTHTNINSTTKPPYKPQRGGANSLAGRVSRVHVQNRNVQPLYFNHCPGHPLIITINQITIHSSQNATSPVHCVQYNQPSSLHAMSKSLEYHTTSTPPL